MAPHLYQATHSLTSCCACCIRSKGKFSGSFPLVIHANGPVWSYTFFDVMLCKLHTMKGQPCQDRCLIVILANGPVWSNTLQDPGTHSLRNKTILDSPMLCKLHLVKEQVFCMINHANGPAWVPAWIQQEQMISSVLCMCSKHCHHFLPSSAVILVVILVVDTSQECSCIKGMGTSVLAMEWCCVKCVLNWQQHDYNRQSCSTACRRWA